MLGVIFVLSSFYRLGILGGSFDPVHEGHIHIATTAAKKLQLDKVLLVPVGISPYKDKNCVASASHRMKMLSIAIQDDSMLSASSVELDSPGVSYTLKTILKLRKIYPCAQMYFISGADAFCKIFSWYKADTLIRLVNFAVLDRCNMDFSTCAERVTSCGGKVFSLHCPQITVSSSMIRSWFSDFPAHSSLISKFVHNNVISYILENHIYT